MLVGNTVRYNYLEVTLQWSSHTFLAIKHFHNCAFCYWGNGETVFKDGVGAIIHSDLLKCPPPEILEQENTSIHPLSNNRALPGKPYIKFCLFIGDLDVI